MEKLRGAVFAAPYPVEYHTVCSQLGMSVGHIYKLLCRPINIFFFFLFDFSCYIPTFNFRAT